MKNTKKKKLIKIKEILDKKTEDDIKQAGNPKSRSIDLWLSIINTQLTSNAKFGNNRELAGFFRFFKFTKKMAETTFQGCFRRIMFYKYEGGLKNEKTN